MVLLLVVFGFRKSVVSVPQNTVLGIVLHSNIIDCLSPQECLMLFGEVGLGHGSTLSLIVTMHSFLVPIGNKGA